MNIPSALRTAAAIGAIAAACVAQAQTWPSKPIRVFVGSPPGAPSDITARLFADQLGKLVNQPVVVENRPGAGNNLAAIAAAKAEGDGASLVLSPDTVLTVNPHVYKSGDFDPRRDLVNVSIVASFSQMLVCHPSVGVKSVGELVAKAQKGRLTYASGGPGVPGHLASEMFLDAARVRMDHIPYRGPAPATQAILSGEVNCGFLATPTVLPHVKAGKLVALAVSSAKPSPLAPQVPTLAQALGQPGLDVSFRLVLQAPRSTPAPMLAEIEKRSQEVMKSPELRAKLPNHDLTAVGSSSAQAQSILNAEIVRWEPVVKRLGLSAD
ncbi:MAG TPA: tripartite tricarboxylate transporter substrate-binding protein [Ramlibacter sp.]|jgi:tripartite-type tricarboxylate transporter receptor subunit TctC|uniref:Bug family tripartite tricarboxylate transporter substrate binding protein n=1 Tax=Ramlibacter sp. TaxID=1917967 RepID=UPI002D34F70B|nr:tripartite tricarboxylate transporter substrate-binding protein [Ramlibacter sp.]HZY17781.1 tripartite tricarboxylate transporter substrate-binding protein [Ramlibacter sp.]